LNRPADHTACLGSLKKIRVRSCLRPAASKSGVIFPSIMTEIAPVSPDIVITTASVSSVIPRAALCRVPSIFPTSGLRLKGRKLPAAIIRSPLITTAPSCSGDCGIKILLRRDFSEATASEIDNEVKRLVYENFERAKNLIRENLKGLRALAEALLEKEVLEAREITEVIEAALA